MKCYGTDINFIGKNSISGCNWCPFDYTFIIGIYCFLLKKVFIGSFFALISFCLKYYRFTPPPPPIIYYFFLKKNSLAWIERTCFLVLSDLPSFVLSFLAILLGTTSSLISSHLPKRRASMLFLLSLETSM